MTLNFSLLDARAGMLVREAFFRLSSLMGAVFSRLHGTASSDRLRSHPESLTTGLVQRRSRLEQGTSWTQNQNLSLDPEDRASRVCWTDSFPRSS